MVVPACSVPRLGRAPAPSDGTFPDWSGDTALILGAGPSAADVAAVLRPGCMRVIAINRSHELVPWAEVLYAADSGFWRQYADARAFKGLKYCADNHVRYFGSNIGTVTIARDPRGLRLTEMVRKTIGVVGYGGNSGFQAVNLAAQFGASRILLCLDYQGSHWHEDHPNVLRNPTSSQFRSWACDLDRQAPILRSWGIEVFNVARNSILKAYPYADCSLFVEDDRSLSA